MIDALAQSKRTTLRKKVLIAFLLALSFASVHFAPVFAAINKQINYQGKLTNASGVAVANGTYEMEFKLYTVSSGGSAIWTETRVSGDEVQVTNGLFSVMLGEVTSLTGVNFNQMLYLGVKIESDAEMTPRKKLGAVPAAIEAENSATVGGFTPSQTPTGSNIPVLSSGALTMAGAITSGSHTVNTATATDDQLIFAVTGGGAARFNGTITSADLTATRTWTFPNASGTVALTSDLTSGYIPYTGGTSNVNLGIHDLTVDTNSLFVDSTNHRVGIGTTGPVDPLSIGTAINASATHALFNLSNTALSSGSSSGTYIGINPGSFSGDFINFQNSSIYKFRVENTGSVYTPADYNILIAGNYKAQISGTQLQMVSGYSLQWSSNATGVSGTGDTYLNRSAANTLRLSSDGSTGSANLVVNGSVDAGTVYKIAGANVVATSAGDVQIGNSASLSGSSLYAGTTRVLGVQSGSAQFGSNAVSIPVYVSTNASGTTAENIYLRNQITSNGSNTSLVFQATNSSGGNENIGSIIGVKIANTPSAVTGDIAFSTVNAGTASEKMRILADGSIKINTAPSTSAGSYDIITRNSSTGLLEKISSTTMPSGSGVTNYVARWTGTNTLSTGVLYDDGTNAYVGPASGNYNIRFTAGNPSIIQSTNSGTTNTNLSLNPAGSGNVLLVSGGTGNVGVGTASPAGLLSIAGNRTAVAWGTAGINFQTVAATYTDSSSSGTVTNNAVNSFGIPTLAASSATTYTNPATLYIAGAPVAGTNVTQTNPLALYVAGGNASFAGSVGISTTAPGVKLDINLGADNGQAIRVNSTAGGVNAGFGIDGSGTYYGTALYVAGTKRFNVESNGAVEIGSTYVTGDGPANGLIVEGNVGIGTTSPTSNLQVNGLNTALSSFQQLFVSSNDSQAIDKGGSIGFGGAYTGTTQTQWAGIAGRKENGTDANFAGYLGLSTRANGGSLTERMRIDSAGNVGIGTTSPVTTFNVNRTGVNTTPPLIITGTGSFSGSPTDTAAGVGIGLIYNTSGNRQFWIGASDSGEGVRIVGGTGAATIDSWNNLTSTALPVYIDPNAVGVKIGATVGVGAPTAKLHIGAGTTSIAPLKFTSGTNLTTAETGAVEYDGTNLYFTPTGTTRKTFAYVSDLTSGYVPYSGATTTVNLGSQNLTTTGSLTSGTGGVRTAGGGNGFNFASQGFFTSPSDGVFKFSDTADTSFGRLQLGGTTSSFPAIKRNGAGIDFRLADDSAYTNIAATYGLFGTVLVGAYNVTAASGFVQSPIIQGGTSTTSTLTLKSTEGVGTTGADIIFKVGNNGATEAMRILNSGNVGIGQSSPGGTLSIVSGATSGTTTSAGLNLSVNSLTTGTGLYVGATSGNNFSSGSLVDLQVSTTAAASNTQKVLNVATAGANGSSGQTTYGGYFSNIHTGSSSKNVGIYATATGGASNYAAIFESGNIGIGLVAPSATLAISAAAPASVGGTAGTNAIPLLSISTGGNGGDTSSNGALVFGGNGGGMTLNAGQGGGITGSPTVGIGGAGGSFSVQAGTGGTGGGTTGTGGAAGNVTLRGGTGGIASPTSADGGYIELQGGFGGGIGNTNGGNVYIAGGLKNSSGTNGNIILGVTQAGSLRGNVGIGTATPTNTLTISADSPVAEAIVTNVSSTRAGFVTTYGGADKWGIVGDLAGGQVKIGALTSGGYYLSLFSNGSERWKIDASGHFLAGANNSYDIGDSGGTARPRTGYFGTSVVTPALTISGITGSTQCLQVNTSGVVSGSGAGCGGSGGANTALSNLASVAINLSLLPGADDSIDLGDNTHRWRDLYLGGETIHLGTSTTDEATIGYTTSSNILNFATDSTTNGDISFFTDDLYLDKSVGFVGIGTTGPTNNLEVSSTANASGITLNGTTNPGLTLKTSGTTRGYLGVNTSSGAWSAGTAINDLVFRAEGVGIGFTTNAGGNTQMYINSSGNVGIGTTSPGKKLDVNGDALINGIVVGRGAANDATNTLVGASVGQSFGASAIYNTFIGNGAGGSTTNSQFNVAVGAAALSAVTGSSYGNVAVGMSALQNNTTGVGNTGLGGQALLYQTTGSNNVGVGSNTGLFLADGTTHLTVAEQSIFIGDSAKANANSEQNQIVIGYGATGAGSNSIVLGNASNTKTILTGNVGIGTTSPVSRLNIGVAPTATANYGTQSIGTGAFDGSTSGFFVGSSSGTSLAVNEVSGYAGDLLNLQVAGTNRLKIAASGGRLATETNGLRINANNTGVGGLTFTGGTLSANAIGVGNTGFQLFVENQTYTSSYAFSINTGTGRGIATSGSQAHLDVSGGFAPTSGTATYSHINVAPTINQTGGANGITRGIYINPTLTAAADFRALEIANNANFAIYQSGASATNYFAGNVGIGTTSPDSLGLLTLNKTSVYGQAFQNSGTTRTYLAQAFSTSDWSPGSAAGDFIVRSQGGNILFTTDSGTSTQLYLKNGGNVGIGTTSPGALLDVSKSQNAVTQLIVQNTNAGGNARSSLLLTSDGGSFDLYRTSTTHTLPDATVFQDSGGGDMIFYGAGETMRLKNNGNVGIGDTTPASLFTVGSGDLFQINSTGQIGAHVAPASDYLFSLAGTTGNDHSRIFDITQADNAAEDTYGISLANTVNPGTITGTSYATRNFYSSITPTVNITTNTSSKGFSIYSSDENIDLSGITMGNSSGVNAFTTAVGSSINITGTPALNDTQSIGTNSFTVYGVSSNITLSPVISSTDNMGLNVYGGIFNTSVTPSTGQSLLNSSIFGVQGTATGDLTTTGATSHTGTVTAATGTADANYGISIATVSGATNNYGIYIGAVAATSADYAIYSDTAAQSYFTGNVGIGDSSPASLLTVGSGDLFQVNTTGDIFAAQTTLNGTSAANGSGSNSTILILQSGDGTDFDVGNYVKVASGVCTANPCFAKITAKSTDTLTISPALSWTSGDPVTEVHISEIGGTNLASTLANRYGRGYFIDGIVTGNGSTYYSDQAIQQTSSGTFHFLDNGNTTTINLGSSATTFNIEGTLNLTGTGPTNFGGDVVLGAQADNTDGGYTIRNTSETAGAFDEETNINGVSSFAIYNGKLYAATTKTDGSAVYRYDGGTTWTLVTAMPGNIMCHGFCFNPTDIDAMVLTVFNGKLYAGTQTGNSTGTGGLYSYDGSTWTDLTSGALGVFDGESGIDSISDLVVYDGTLYVATEDDDVLASVYRFGGTTNSFTRTSQSSGACSDEGAEIRGGKLSVYKGRLYWGTQGTNGTAKLCVYAGYGNPRQWFSLNRGDISAGNFIPGDSTGIHAINSMTVHNGRLFIGTSRDGNEAEIYSFSAQMEDQIKTEFFHGVFQKEVTTMGRIDDISGSTSVDRISALRDYNGRLYAGGDSGVDGGQGQVYEYDDTTRLWTIITADGAGEFGSQTGVDSANAMIPFNGTLYIGTMKEGNGAIYTWNKTSTNSYGLKFDSGSGNMASISFVGNETAEGNAQNTGNFLFSHSIVSTTGAYDVAEDYPTREEGLTAGDVMMLDPNEEGLVKRSTGDYSMQVLGIYSEKPGLRLSQSADSIDGLEVVPVALAGRVPVKVTIENGAIKAGDMLTVSATIPGYAMKAIKGGVVIGQALGAYAGTEPGKVLAFIKNSYSNGPKLADVLPEGLTLDGNQTETIENRALNYFVAGKLKLAESKNLSEILVDRVTAGLEVITPTLFADTVQTNTITTSTGENITVTLGTEGKLIVNGETQFDGLSFFSMAASFEGAVTFNGETEFTIPPLFNKDTAGFAIIKKGARKVQITFDTPYIAEPVVGTSLVFNTASNITAAAADAIFADGGVQSLVVDSDQNGFTILLSKPATHDLRFAWNALRVKDPKIFESVMDGLVVESPTPTPEPAPSGETPPSEEVIDICPNINDVQSTIPSGYHIDEENNCVADTGASSGDASSSSDDTDDSNTSAEADPASSSSSGDSSTPTSGENTGSQSGQ